MKHLFDKITSDFRCKHCHNYVSTDPILSGVNNRNHCPYCLYSRHLDLYQAGDRLAACKEKMRPVALALKQTRKKYGSDQGELMLVHQCLDCGSISINRIAADDDAETILSIFESSMTLNPHVRDQISSSGIQALDESAAPVVRARLFGWQYEPQHNTAVYA
jgi:hypothetical protein